MDQTIENLACGIYKTTIPAMCKLSTSPKRRTAELTRETGFKIVTK
jgi:hypothetical protein